MHVQQTGISILEALRNLAGMARGDEDRMSDQMTPISFEKMLQSLITEYKQKGSFYDVPVRKENDEAPIGAAAGPHTQLAGNIVAAYGAGANYFELKTVQILQGDELGIVKPCIDVSYEVYNTEWSTELKISKARYEYIKAYLLIAVLSSRFDLKPIEKLQFIASVGYDLKGIKSEMIDDFLESMKHPERTDEWQKDIAYIKLHRKEIGLSEEAVQQIEAKREITDTVTLSTMHGCQYSEIQAIVMHLMKEKGMNTFIKLNPTLIGKEKIRKLLKQKGYTHIDVVEEIFETDMTLNEATALIGKLKEEADQLNKVFGIKLTNTLPVKNKEGRLEGETKYLSGKPLYPIAIEAAAELIEQLKVEVPVSYSGGIDTSNINEVLKTGIAPITVSSLILKPGGYKNFSKLMEQSKAYKPVRLNKELLKQLAESAALNEHYNNKPFKQFELKEDYSCFCGKCNNCVDICPNRANIPFYVDGKKGVMHLDALCNECGSCKCECIMGHSPYKEKFTVYSDYQSFEQSEGIAALYEDEKLILKNSENIKIPELEIKEIITSRLDAGRL